MGLILLLLTVAASVASLDVRVDPLVLLDQGLVRGVRATDGDYAAFLGVPYAQVDYTNPFGDALQAPVFNDVFIANNDATACPQQLSEFQVNNEPSSLECLKLNIFVPSSSNSQNLLPVMVWIHGGGFEVGKGDTKNAFSIVKHDIVYVTINYRLGPYGFMCLDVPSVPGNQGLKDQQLALQWVKDNIAAFGGNPSDITIAGQSAGGASVNFHLYSAQEKLFNKAIIQSCTAQTTGVFTKGDVTVAIRLAEHLGYNTTNTESALTFLATISSELVVAATNDLGIDLKPCKELSFSGIQNFIDTDPYSITNKDKIKNTPILIGVTSKELGGGPSNDNVYSTNSFSEVLGRSFDLEENELNEAASIVSHFYLGDDSISSVSTSVIQTFQSDFFFNHALEREVYKLVNTQSAGPVYEYVFSYLREDEREVKDGASHGAEMFAIFEGDSGTLSEEDQVVATTVNSLWANFIKYGNPTPDESTLTWQPVGSDSRPYLMIDSVTRMESRFKKESMAFWDLFYRTYGSYNKLVRDCL